MSRPGVAAAGVRDSDRTEYGMEESVRVAPTAGGPATEVPDTGAPDPGPPGRGTRHRDSPRVRRLARQRAVDLHALVPSGPHGRATADDVRAAATGADRATRSEASVPGRGGAEPGGRVERLSPQRRSAGEHLVASLRTAAQLTTVVEVDLSRVVAAPVTAFGAVAEAAVRALGQHPVLNARLDPEAGTVTHPADVDLGIAVDTDRGPLVPVVRGAQDLSRAGLARRIAEATARTRDGSTVPDEPNGPTFTITDTGARGALFDTPLLRLPEAATLAVGAAVRRPVVVTGPDGGDLIAVRPTAFLALTYDHRLVDGADAARFLGSVKERLEHHGGTRPAPLL